MTYTQLNLTGSSAPHIRTGSGIRQMMLSVMAALLPALGFAVYMFGPRPAVNVLVSMAGCCVFELLFRVILRKNITVGDGSAALTGMLLALMCPASVPYWLLVLGDFIAIVLVKQLFGGLGKNPLNPALTARLVLLLWRGEMDVLPVSGTDTALWGNVDAVTSPTPMALLRANDFEGLREAYSIPELFVGLTPGAAGEISALLLMLGGLFLLFRKVISWRIPAGYLGMAALLTFIFSWGNPHAEWMLYELFGGGLMLAAFFVVTDPVTSPVSPLGQLIYGAGCGFLTVLFRYYGLANEGICAAVLLMNLAAIPLDQFLLTGHVEKPVLPPMPNAPKLPKMPAVPKLSIKKKTDDK